MLIVAVLITAIAGCGSPQEKKMKFYNKGQALYEKGDFVKASLEFKNAIQIDPKFTDGYYMLGMIALKKGELRQAYGALSKVVALNPDHTKAQLELGKIYLTANAPDKAKEQADLILKKQPGNDDALTLRAAVLLVTNHIPESKAILENLMHKA